MQNNLTHLINWNNIEREIIINESVYLLTEQTEDGFLNKIKAAGIKLVEWFKNIFNDFKIKYAEFKNNKLISSYDNIILKCKSSNKAVSFKIKMFDIDKVKQCSDALWAKVNTDNKTISIDEFERLKADLLKAMNDRKETVYGGLSLLEHLNKILKDSISIINLAASKTVNTCKDGISEGNKMAKSKTVDDASAIKKIIDALKDKLFQLIYIFTSTFTFVRSMLGILITYETCSIKGGPHNLVKPIN